MAAAIVDMDAHLPDQAMAMAEAANQYFSTKDEKESEWLSLYYVAKACKLKGDIRNSSINAQKAIDISANSSKVGVPPLIASTLTGPIARLSWQSCPS